MLMVLCPLPVLCPVSCIVNVIKGGNTTVTCTANDTMAAGNLAW